jgi:phosphatidylserine decarboxylase
MEGKVMQQWLDVARKIQDEATGSNQEKRTSYAQWIQSDEKDDVVIVFDAVPHGPRPRCYAQSGERIGQGQRCGFVRFGAQIEILLPENTRLAVAVGDTVRAGSAIIATLVHSKTEPPKVTEAVNG